MKLFYKKLKEFCNIRYLKNFSYIFRDLKNERTFSNTWFNILKIKTFKKYFWYKFVRIILNNQLFAELCLALYEIVSAVVRGHLRRDYAKPVLSEVLVSII